MTILISLITLVLNSASANDCVKRHGAVDIGTGSTKAFAAIVDVCRGDIVKTLYDKQIPVAFGEDLAKSKSQELSAEFIKKAAPEISALLEPMKAMDLSRITLSATAAFRNAKNGADAAATLSKTLGYEVKILSQDGEAELGAVSAQVVGGIRKKDHKYIVWDIGGGSMQMYTKGKDGTVHTFKGDLASVSFKRQVIEKVQHADPAKVSTPNPLKGSEREAISLSRDHAKANVPEVFKTNATKFRWLGVGGVFAKSLKKQMALKHTKFNRSDLQKTLNARAKLTDAEIDSDYRDTEVTNLALVLGYMDALNIPRVQIVEASLAQGALFQ